MRRKLKLEDLNQVVAEAEDLLQAGYTRSGNWSLGQACCHVRLTIESNMNGYPTWMAALGFPLRPVLRWFVLPSFLAGRSPGGIPTAGMFVPADNLDDANEVAKLKQCVALFIESRTALHAHPGFGKMSREGFAAFHAAHAAHHFSFLQAEGSK